MAKTDFLLRKKKKLLKTAWYRDGQWVKETFWGCTVIWVDGGVTNFHIILYKYYI